MRFLAEIVAVLAAVVALCWLTADLAAHPPLTTSTCEETP